MDGLVAQDIVVRFGGLVALDGVSIEAPPKHITGLIGPNGAGKTTMFNVCSGFQVANQGRVYLDGIDVTGKSPAHRARLGLGRTFQRMELFRSLTVRENLELAAESSHVGDDPLTQLGLVGGGRSSRRQGAKFADELIEMTGLSEVADALTAEISTGQGRLVELARALARRPRILLLDEASSGLDVAETTAMGRLLSRIVAEQDLGILLVEHDMGLVLSICDRIHVLDFGKSLMTGTPDEVRTSPVVREAYLGKEGAA
jgi:ABC-type branched-subunit amino acid transport system ATPase component